MTTTIIILCAASLTQAVVIGMLLNRIRKLRSERDAARIREGYPWDWTKEDERRAQAALELICDKCHEPFRCSQDELDAACAMCPVPDVIYKMAGRKEVRE